MKSFSIVFVVGAFLAFAVWTGCHDTTPAGPAGNLGANTVVKYVAIGNSLSAGYQSNALFESGQRYSFPNLIAQQLNVAGAGLAPFQQPIYSDPGSPDPVTGKAARYEIINLVGPVIGPRGLTPGAATNTGLTRPYDNLGVPGAVIFDFLDTTNIGTKAVARNNPFFQLVMRNQAAFGTNLLAQAAALRPDLVTFWLGNNDVLGFATSGGVSPSSPTPSSAFAALYTQALGALRSSLPNARIVVGNVFDVHEIPFFTTLGPKIAALLPAGYYLRYQKHGVTGPSFDSTRFTGTAFPFICLTGSPYAPLLGTPSGAWYRNNRYPALPPGIDTTKPFGLHPQNPWPDALVLDESEQATTAAAVAAFNSAIASAAASNNAALVDMNALFHSTKANGYYANGHRLTADYVTGGLFSLDGVHPSSKGSGVLANEFVRAINKKWGMSVPFVDVASLPALIAPVGKTSETGIPVLPPDAFNSLAMLWGAGM